MNAAEFAYLREFLRERSGLDLPPEKRYLVESRLLPVARRAGLSGVGQLIAAMREGSACAQTDAVEAMMTHETYFFRDKTPFDQLRELLPKMMRARESARHLRIWCAAASTGQEPYSVAMLLKEIEAQLAGWRVDIMATDLSDAALERARAGVFTQFEVQRGLPIGLLLQHFHQSGDHWRLHDDIRAMVQFRRANLVEDFRHLGSFDVILCRNVLIYFGEAAKRDVLSRLAAAVAPGGVVMLGGAETTIGLTDALMPVPGRRGLYQSVPGTSVRRGNVIPIRAAALG